jgi:aryl-alcohol dehydrogenase-like predicted oxidoreductase
MLPGVHPWRQMQKAEMKYRPLGSSSVKVSEVSLGCWTMGGLNWVNGNPNGWADVEFIRAIFA